MSDKKTKTVFLVVYGQRVLKEPNVVGIFTTLKKAEAGKDVYHKNIKTLHMSGRFPYFADDYTITEYFLDV